MKASEMTIEEAIRHAEEVAQRKCDECGNQHQQLANWLKELVVLRLKLKVAEEICEHEIACRQKIQARCEMCIEDSSAGEDCPYHGEPCGCNSPTYGDFPTEKEYAPFVKILSEIRKEGRVK